MTIKTKTMPMPSSEVPNCGSVGPVESTTPNKALDMYDIVTSMATSSRLNRDASQYIDEINKIFEDSHASITSIPITTNRIEARVFVSDATRDAIALLFAETYQPLDSVPPSMQGTAVLTQVAAIDKTIRVVQCIVVTKEDYALAGNMAAFIINAFKTLSGDPSSNLSVEQLRGLNIRVVTAIEVVRDYVRKHSPHAISERDDIGVLLCFEIPRKGQFGGYNSEIDLVPFQAITGYTRIMDPKDATTGAKFVPLPTITNIISSIPNVSLLSLALPIAADAFMMQNLWIRPYTTFSTGNPNLGNLIMDINTKKPLFTDSNESFHAFVNQHLTPPFLSIDITDGRARPVAIDELISCPAGIFNCLRKFYNSKVSFNSETGCLQKFVNYTGTYQHNGTVRDTRWVDYLELACKIGNPKTVEDLLIQPTQPQIRIERVRDIYRDNTRSLYTTTTVVLDANVMLGLNQALADAELNLKYDTPPNGNVNMSKFLNPQLGAMYSNFRPIGGYNNQNSSFNQYTTRYSNIFK